MMSEIDDLVYKWKQGHAKILELSPRMPYELAAKISLELVKLSHEKPKEKKFEFDKHAKDQPPSQKQLELMKKLKIPIPDNCTMAIAHGLIADKLKTMQQE